MKKALLFLILSAFPALAQINPSNQMATIVFGMTNAVGRPDTNYFILYQVDGVVLANGGVRTIGFGQRCYPNTIGVFVTNLMTGFYQITNAFLGKGVIIQVPPNTNTYPVSLPVTTNSIAISGFNTYQMTGVLGLTSSNGSIAISPGNGVGFVDLAGSGSIVYSNVVTQTIIVTNPPESASLTSASLYFTNSFGFVVAIQPSQGHIADFEILAGATNVPLVSVASINSNSVSLYEPLDLFSTSNGQEWFYDSTGTNVIAGYNGSNWFTASMSTAPGSNSFFTTFGNSHGVTNHMLTVIAGILTDYWSDGTNVYFQQLAPASVSPWINDPSIPAIRPINDTTLIFIGDLSQASSFVGAAKMSIYDTNATYPTILTLNKQITGSQGGTILQVIRNGGQGTINSSAISGTDNQGGPIVGGTYFGNDSSSGVSGISGSNGNGATNSATGLNGYAKGNDGLLIGVLGESDAHINGTTNVGGLFNVLTEGKTGPNAALYAESRISPIADGTDDPILETAVSVFDSRETGMDLSYWRTNNGTHVASLDKNGDMTARQFIGKTGYLFHSNTVANLPTLAKGDAFLWSSNGVFFAIRSDASGTILTNPVAMLPISPTNVLLVAGANIAFTTNGDGSVTIAASGTITINTITNNTFVNTNVMILTSNATFVIKNGGKVVFETNAVLVYSNAIPNSLASFDSLGRLTNAALAARFTFTGNTLDIASGSIPNGDLINSSVTLSGTANQVSVSGGGPLALGGTATLSTPNPFIAPGPISGTQITNTSFAAVGIQTNDANGKEYTTPTLPNSLLANSAITINQISTALGGTASSNGGALTNLNYGAVTGGVSFIQIDASALWTNATRTPGALVAVTPGAASTSVQGSGPAFPALWPVSTTGSNDFYFQFYPPPGYQGTFTVSGNYISATNSATKLAIVQSCALSGAGAALGTAVTVTNSMTQSTGFINTNITSTAITCSGSPVANTPIVGLLQPWGGQAGFTASNLLYLVGVRVSWTNSSTQNALLTGW